MMTQAVSGTAAGTRGALAIEGGRPVRDRYLPYGRQWVSEPDVEAVAEVLRGDWLTQGPKVAELERAVAEGHLRQIRPTSGGCIPRSIFRRRQAL